MALLKKTLFKKQIPTVIGLLILFVGGIAGIILVGNQTNFLPRASAEYAPKQLKITNTTDRSFTVSWLTDQSTTGFIRYGTTTSLGTTMEDERDQLSGNTGNFKTHYITVRGLTAGSKYYFKIGSGPNRSLFDNDGQPYEITLGGDLGSPPSSQVASGTVVTNAQTPAEGSIVYLNLPGGSPLSALVRSSGSWAITLSNARTQDLTSYLTLSPDGLASFQIIGSDGTTTTGSLPANSLNPAPIITLGQSFGQDQNTLSALPTSPTPSPTGHTQDNQPSPSSTPTPTPTSTPTPTPAQSQFDLEPLSGDSAASDSGTIINVDNPSTDGEEINTAQPKFQGTADPGSTVTIKVESDPVYEDTVVVDEDGDFSWTPPDDLAPGEHTVTITKEDGTTVTRTFIIAAPGDSELPSLTSSPSASTIESTPTPTPSTTSGRTSQPSTQSGIPTAGTITPTVTLFLIGLTMIFSGIFLHQKISLD